jgi:hypothetical protein
MVPVPLRFPPIAFQGRVFRGWVFRDFNDDDPTLGVVNLAMSGLKRRDSLFGSIDGARQRDRSVLAKALVRQR